MREITIIFFFFAILFGVLLGLFLGFSLLCHMQNVSDKKKEKFRRALLPSRKIKGKKVRKKKESGKKGKKLCLKKSKNRLDDRVKQAESYTDFVCESEGKETSEIVKQNRKSQDFKYHAKR